MRGITRLAGPAPPLTIRQTCKMLMPMLAALSVSAALLPEQVVMSIGSNTPSAARVLEGSQNAHEIRVPVHSPTRPDEQGEQSLALLPRLYLLYPIYELN